MHFRYKKEKEEEKKKREEEEKKEKEEETEKEKRETFIYPIEDICVVTAAYRVQREELKRNEDIK